MVQVSEKEIFDLLDTVCDPEIPVLTIADLGIIRDVIIHEDDQIEVVITPTYSGCPAMNTIEVGVKATLQDAGFDRVKVTTVLSPAWTTDWMTEEGKSKLKEYGIAPPVGSVSKRALFGDEPEIPCPHCGSVKTEMISQFGSTACKSLYKCHSCLEPFDYFKCH